MIENHELEHEIINLDDHIREIVIQSAPVGGGGGGGGVSAETDPVFLASEAALLALGDAAKLAGIEAGAEVNNITDANATDLTDGGTTTLHKHNISEVNGVEPSIDHSITFTLPATANSKSWLEVPWDCTITDWTITTDASGSCVLDLWNDTYGNYPPTVADTITASAKPTLSSDVKATSSTLTGWDTALTKKDYLLCNVDSASGLEVIYLKLSVIRT